MALTDTRHEATEQAADSSSGDAPDRALVALDAYFGTGDHKAVGRLWLVCGTLFLLAGAIISLVAAVEPVDLGSLSISDDAAAFTELWSLGRDLLVFGGIIPLLIGLAVYIVPLQVGSQSLAFPRGAAAAFWMWLAGTILLIVSYGAGGGPGGWSTDQVLMWAVSLGVVVLALLWSMVCVASTVLGARTAGMDLDRVPVACWGFFVFSLGGLFTLPIVVAQLVIGYLDVRYGYLPDETSRIALVSVVDSVTVAPGLYWLALPALGIAVDAIAVHTGRPIRFHRAVLGLIGLLAVVSYSVHFFAFAGPRRQIAFDNGLMVVDLLVAVVPVLGVLALAGESLKAGKASLRTPLLSGLMSGLLLLLATLTSLVGVVWPIVAFVEKNFDINVNLDSSLDLAGTSFHDGVRGLVFGAAVLGIIAGTHHWAHKVWGRSFDDRLGVLACLAAAGGGVLMGVGGVVSGLLGQTRLPAIDSEVPGGVEAFNIVSLVGVALLAVAILILLANLAKAAAGRGSANEPWRGLTLEWATSSPPIASNFVTPPVVHSSTPLADPNFRLAGPSESADVETEHA